MTEQVVKSKDLRKLTKEWMAVFFHKLCDKSYLKSCKYMRNNSTKLSQFTIWIKVSSTTVQG